MKHVVIIWVIGMLFVGCAQVSRPTGGEKDIHPPLVDRAKTNPPLNSTSFSNQEIHIYFDEFFKLKNPNSNIIITPRLEEPPSYRVKGKSLIVELGDQKLIENATYTINFGDAIQDYTEGNILKNFQYVFSTGTFIDSLSINGVVKDAFTGKPVNDASVMIFEINDRDSVKTTLPLYFGTTGKTGTYKINHLKPGNYTVIALKEERKNYKFDNLEESIAFSGQSTILNDSKQMNFRLSQPAKTKQKILSKEYSHPGKISLLMQMASENIRFTLGEEQIPFVQNSPYSFDLFLTNSATIKPSINFEVTDNTNEFKSSTSVSLTKNINDTLPLNLSSNTDKGLGALSDLKISTNVAFTSIDAEKIIALEGDNKINVDFRKTSPVEIQSAYNFRPEHNYRLTFLPGAFDIEYLVISDTIQIDFKKRQEKDYGNILLDISLPRKIKYILELIQKDEVLQTLTGNSSSIREDFNLVNPGSYELRLIEDLNEDGKWTTGDFDEKKQPEKVYYYGDPISIKANWDLELIWEVKL